jgi:hypothetical protein
MKVSLIWWLRGFAILLALNACLTLPKGPVLPPRGEKAPEVTETAIYLSWENRGQYTRLLLLKNDDPITLDANATSYFEPDPAPGTYTFALRAEGPEGSLPEVDLGSCEVRKKAPPIHYPGATHLTGLPGYGFSVLYTIAEGIQFDSARYRFADDPALAAESVDLKRLFQDLTATVLGHVFEGATSVAADGYMAVARQSESLRGGADYSDWDNLPDVHRSRLLLEIDFLPPFKNQPQLSSQLVVRFYDLTSKSNVEWNSLPLLFEEYGEVCVGGDDLGPVDEFPNQLLEAYQGIFQALVAERDLADYQRALGQPNHSMNEPEDLEIRALLGHMPEHATPGPTLQWLEEQVLFPEWHDTEDSEPISEDPEAEVEEPAAAVGLEGDDS